MLMIIYKEPPVFSARTSVYRHSSHGNKNSVVSIAGSDSLSQDTPPNDHEPYYDNLSYH